MVTRNAIFEVNARGVGSDLNFIVCTTERFEPGGSSIERVGGHREAVRLMLFMRRQGDWYCVVVVDAE